jgi:hypothetical protein
LELEILIINEVHVMKKIFLFIPLTLLAFSCEKKATIKLPDPENKLVVTCFISPQDSVITAVVRLSIPKFSSNGTYSALSENDIKNATVIISDGNNNLTLPFNNDLNFYKANALDLPIIAGKQYFLTVTTPDGKNIKANTTVPNGVLTIESLTFTPKNIDTSSIEYDINLIVPDIPNEINYVAFFYETTLSYAPLSNTLTPTDPINSTYSNYVTDEKINKTKYIETSNANFSSLTKILTAMVNVSVLNCSKDFYLYNKSVQESAGISNPFTDPVQVYTNIQNGFGCFGAYTVSKESLKIR